MALNLTSPVTGTAQTGFTSPTYTLFADSYPNGYNGKQWIVTALGGTQTGVTAHSVTSPFSISVARPPVLKGPNYAKSTTGFIVNNNRNVWKIIVRKGALPAANERVDTILGRCEWSVPAGCETYSVAELRAAISLMIGSLSQMSAALGDSMNNGTV